MIYGNEVKYDTDPDGYKYDPIPCGINCKNWENIVVKEDGNTILMKQSLEPSLKVQMELDQHEKECAIRYEMVNKTLEQLDKRLWRLEAITIASNLAVLSLVIVLVMK